MKLIVQIKSYWLIIIILVVAAILRFWHLEELTTFSGDQGYDFLIVKRMIADGKFTLLGPKIGPYNGVGDLYLGPAYYYLLAPSLLLFRLDPIGPAVLTVVASLGTIFLIYKIGVKYFRRSIAILSASLYAINALLIDQSRAASNPHLIPLFASLATYVTLEMTYKKSKLIVWPLICGICLGIMFQLHYLTTSFTASVFIILLFIKRFRAISFVTLGFLAAISGQILFEIRHEFFITNQFIKQISFGQNILPFNKLDTQISNSVQQLSLAFLNTSKFLYLVIPILLVSVLLYTRKNQKSTVPIALLTLTVILGLILPSFYSGEIGFHYFAPIYPSFIILISIALISIFKVSNHFAPRTVVIILIAQIFTANLITLNLTRQEGYTMPKGWNLKGIKKASEIIAQDSENSKFNIASTLDGDTRARPYRYLVETKGKIPLDVEHYPDAEIVYLIARDDRQTVKSYTVWEVASLAPFEFEGEWEIQNNIKLYKLAKN